MSAEIKDIVMDVREKKGRKSRRRRRTPDIEETEFTKDEQVTEQESKQESKQKPKQESKQESKQKPKSKSNPNPNPKPSPNPVISPKSVLAPPKKKAAKVVLVPKTEAGPKPVRPAVRKTYSAKALNIVIDNSHKTRKRRRAMLNQVELMTDEQVRDAAVNAGLSRRETVAKAPIGLLRQMVKDIQIMKGRLQ